MLNFKHMSAPTHIKGPLIHWKLSICRNTLLYQLLCWASYRITPYQVTLWKKKYHLNRSWLRAELLIAKSCLSTCGTPLQRPMSSPALTTAAQQRGASPKGSACLELLFQPLPSGSKKKLRRSYSLWPKACLLHWRLGRKSTDLPQGTTLPTQGESCFQLRRTRC